MTDPERQPPERRPPELRPDEAIHIDAEDARGAEIVLRKRRNRMIFIAGLAGFVVLAIALRLLS